jgi:hypothetical protein
MNGFAGNTTATANSTAVPARHEAGRAKTVLIRHKTSFHIGELFFMAPQKSVS